MLLLISILNRRKFIINLYSFRFGKHRKTLDTPIQLGVEEGTRIEGGEREAARRAAQEEQRRIQEQYQRLVQRQRQLENAQVFIAFSYQLKQLL